MQKLCIIILSITLLAGFSALRAEPSYAKRADVSKFIDQLAHNDGFDKAHLRKIFNDVKPQQSILHAIQRPYEKKPWYIYRQFFLKPDRIKKGVLFWNQHKKVLLKAQEEFGVPPEIIVAIIGIETKYGERTGNYRVIDALSTLAFDYPTRAKFFSQELREFLLLSKQNHLDVNTVKGSYAGAIGLPQFIPSSIRRFAIDYSQNGKIDLLQDPVDAIGSIANYLKQNGWQQGGNMVTRARADKNRLTRYLNFKAKKRSESFKPRHTLRSLKNKYGAAPLSGTFSPQEKVILFSLQEPDKNEYWLGFQNFFAITRYNISKHYAMMVITLASEIKRLHHAQRRLNN